MSDDPKLQAHDPQAAATEQQGYEVAQIDPKSDFDLKWVDYVDGGNDRRLYGQVQVFGSANPVRMVISKSDTHPNKWQWLINAFEPHRQMSLKRDNVASADIAKEQAEAAFRNWVKLEDGFQDEERAAETPSVAEPEPETPDADGPGSA